MVKIAEQKAQTEALEKLADAMPWLIGVLILAVILTGGLGDMTLGVKVRIESRLTEAAR